MKKRQPKPPGYLGQTSREWFTRMTEVWAFGRDEVELLAQAATQLDRIEQARTAITEKGPLVTNRYGNLTANPAVELERKASETFARLVRQLKLEREPRRRVGRPWAGSQSSLETM
jgi:phage terminase small subunit